MSIREFHRQRFVLHPPASSSTAEDKLPRRSNRDLGPVPEFEKKWEWCHIAGFWIIEDVSVSQMQTASAALALGLNPCLALGLSSYAM